MADISASSEIVTDDESTPSLRMLLDTSEQEAAQILLEYGQFSDLTITCQGTTFKVHKFVLVTKGGDFFKHAICSGFRESQSSVIDLPEDEPEIITRLLSHLYTGSYAEHLLKEASGGDDDARVDADAILLHVKMFAVAVKYGIKSPRDAARKAFVANFTARETDMSNVLPLVIKAVYSTTAPDERELRDLCTYDLLFEQALCTPNRNDSSANAMLEVLSAVPELAVDACVFWLDSFNDDTHTFYCAECEKSVDWIARPCACKKWKVICGEDECDQARKAASICPECGAKGSLERAD
ncbi:uncharacterized protein AB675_7477 [Cyphellophora attinorum]|uniref:BTB domain-containing protein n=1 Tax=Cyphellophora attinorum TaxID=1664694 RepID=A0A0N0NMG5_9EURO|nr:uncharacterized protein AB675_7477 [Phialophora attinorum]KPI40328.1 hypothetical protein AB675_7477 [Phialophora attinorum]